MNPSSPEPNEIEVMETPPTPATQATQQSVGSGPPISVEDQIPEKILTIPNTIHAIASRSPRSLGGEVTAAFITAHVGEITRERDKAQTKYDSECKATQDLRSKIADLDQKLAIATLKLATAERDGNIKAVLNFIGVAIAGYGVDSLEKNPQVGLILAVSGAAIVAGGWLFIKKQK